MCAALRRARLASSGLFASPSSWLLSSPPCLTSVAMPYIPGTLTFEWHVQRRRGDGVRQAARRQIVLSNIRSTHPRLIDCLVALSQHESRSADGGERVGAGLEGCIRRHVPDVFHTMGPGNIDHFFGRLRRIAMYHSAWATPPVVSWRVKLLVWSEREEDLVAPWAPLVGAVTGEPSQKITNNPLDYTILARIRRRGIV